MLIVRKKCWRHQVFFELRNVELGGLNRLTTSIDGPERIQRALKKNRPELIVRSAEADAPEKGPAEKLLAAVADIDLLEIVTDQETKPRLIDRPGRTCGSIGTCNRTRIE